LRANLNFGGSKSQTVPEKNNLSIKENWIAAANTPLKRFKLYGGTIIIFIIMAILPPFFKGIEKRNGVVLNDWVLAHIPPHNVSVLIFICIWGMAILILYRALYKPTIYIIYIWALIFVCLLRMLAISIVALNPPIGLIPLADPLTGIFYGETSITKDLFFSGHISTLMLIFLCLERKWDKRLALIVVFIAAVLLLIQHIHYTIDILAAPIVTYTMYRFTRWFILYEPAAKGVK
jgi:hypothetical protein